MPTRIKSERASSKLLWWGAHSGSGSSGPKDHGWRSDMVDGRWKGKDKDEGVGRCEGRAGVGDENKKGGRERTGERKRSRKRRRCRRDTQE